VGLCECRKPKPGLLQSLMRELALDPRATFMVGDTMHDVEAGAAAGTRTGLLVDLGRCELCPLKDAAAPRGHTSHGEPRHGASAARPDLVAPRLDLLARAIVDALA
jgi:D-glycero-D-manno-heptose 1,7-bisphosphate phosphatase